MKNQKRRRNVIKLLSLGLLAAVVGTGIIYHNANADTTTQAVAPSVVDITTPTASQKNDMYKNMVVSKAKYEQKVAQEKAEQERLAREKAEQERQAQEKAEQERQVQAEQERQAAQAQAVQEQAVQAQTAQVNTPAKSSQSPNVYHISAQAMDVTEDQKYIDSNPSMFCENTIFSVQYFAAHMDGAGSFISGLKLGDIIVVNNSRQYRVDKIQVITYGSEEARNIIEAGPDAVIQTCTDFTKQFNYFNSLTRIN